MITFENIIEAQDYLVENWGEDGKNVILACFHEKPFNDSFKNFLSYCTACGGNWGGMLLTGINKLYPKVYEAIPDNMGCFAWVRICDVLLLLGVDTTE